MTTASTHNQYAFRNSSDHAATQLSHLENFLDPITVPALERVGVAPGARCLEIGAGRGSVSHWLAERVGDTGEVTTIDIDPHRIAPAANLRILRHDLRQGLPVEGPFDVVHARLVLSHIAERAQLLKALVEVLAPGGWLVVGEFVRDPVRVIAADTEADAALYVKVSDAIYDGLTGVHGADLRFGHDVFNLMGAAGLRRVQSSEYAQSWTGGGGGSDFLYSNSFQLEPLIRANRVGTAELEEYRRLVFKPGLTVKSNLFVNTVGRKPDEPG